MDVTYGSSLDTDYETYYAGYNCRDIPLLGLKIEGGWVFTREGDSLLLSWFEMARFQTAEINPCHCRHLLPFKEASLEQFGH